MNTKNNFENEINNFLENLNKKANDSIKSFENIRNIVINKLNKQIDILYKKKDFIADIFVNRTNFRKFKISIWASFKRTKTKQILKYLLSAPFIYGMVIPTVFMHICIEIYHQICFRLYGIPCVNMKKYFIFDRALLPYLNLLEKVNCFYCSYFNCLISYIREIAARTERFWCPIKHAKNMQDPHDHYQNFTDYNDAENTRENWKKMSEFDELKK
jgi:hypothetical protein